MISKKVAEDQLEIFFESYEIEVESMPDVVRNVIETCQNKLITAIIKGRLEITKEDGNLRIKQNLHEHSGDATEIIYGKLNGSAKASMKDNMSNNEKLYALMGSLSGLTVNAIKKLEGLDHSTMENLGLVFLQI